VDQKDAVIDLLEERTKTLNIKIAELEANGPDALTKALSNRIDIALNEIKRLNYDIDKNKSEITKKETELMHIRKINKALLTNGRYGMIDTVIKSIMHCVEKSTTLKNENFYLSQKFLDGPSNDEI
jgi:hypothetical protein